jgi:hypothetical protein
MALNPGTRIGHYEVVEAIGAGLPLAKTYPLM